MSQVVRESDIQRSILDYLQLRKFIAFKYNSTQYGIRDGKSFAFKSGNVGVSDILACSPSGKFVAIEVKKPGGKPSDAQVAFINQVSKQGGIAAICYSLDEAISLITANQAVLF